ncbi:MAG: aconitate hydratase, partial [Mariprofundales bacterium]
GKLYAWDNDSTYVQNPPYFQGMQAKAADIKPIANARVLAKLGDSVTTDHISPAGAIKADSPAGAYLQERGVGVADFNSYGSRRGNHEIMMRGTFANIRLRNLLLPNIEGNVSVHIPSGDQESIFATAMRYRDENTACILLAGKEYGCGSSRDWAAKGPCLLGVRAVIAESYERIHRSNLVGMGILPLQYADGDTANSLQLDGFESYDIAAPASEGGELCVTATSANGDSMQFTVQVRIDTPKEFEYYQNGGILQYVLRQLIN